MKHAHGPSSPWSGASSRHDASRQRKRIGLTVMAIAWGTLSIVLLLSFGEGLKRSFHKGTRGMGEDIAVLWPGATTKACAGLPSGRAISFRDEDAELLRARIPEIAAHQPRVRATPRRHRGRQDGERARARGRARLRRDPQPAPRSRAAAS